VTLGGIAAAIVLFILVVFTFLFGQHPVALRTGCSEIGIILLHSSVTGLSF
jgi:hypothetical protein